jgi:histidinol phosphatase-like enzyme
MQRWIKLPDGRFVDANRIVYVGKTETFTRIDEDGNDLGVGYAVNIGTGIERATQLTVTGSRDEVLGVLRTILGRGEAPPAA